MDRVVIFCEHVFKQFSPKPVELAESFTNQSKEFVVSPLLTTTLDDHAGQFIFTTSGEIDAHELVTSFLEATRRHDCQVDGTAKVDKIRIGLVLDFHRLLNIVFARI
jgi:hypothetical protein